MPLVHIYVGQGRADKAQKTNLIGRITQVFEQVLGSDPKNVWVIVHDVPRTQWGIDGKPLELPGPGEPGR